MDLNSALPRDLQALPGVGHVTARLIIEARPFASVEDLLQVKGIGPTKFAAMIAQHEISVNEVDSLKTTKLYSRASTVDLNLASIRELQELKGVGPVLAQRIIQARPFYRKEDLLAVQGISSKSYVKIQTKAHVGRPTCDSIHNKDDDTTTNCKEVSQDREQKFRFCRELERDVRESVFSMLSHESRDDRTALIVASWNLRNISRQKATFLLQRIADVVSEFDLVALQEVRDLMVLKRLKTMLPGWDYVVSDPVGRITSGVSARLERYAFFYRRSVVRLVGKCTLTKDTSKVLARRPCVATFRATSESNVPSLELAIMNVHVSFGKKDRRHEEIVEINRLATEMSSAAPLGRKVVVLGDFNLSPHDVLGSLGSQKMALIRSPLSTTVFGKLYDNIWLNRKDVDSQNGFDAETEYFVESGVLRVDWRYYPASKSSQSSMQHPVDKMLPRLQTHMSRVQCSYELSDHCPVWVAFAVSKCEQNCLIEEQD